MHNELTLIKPKVLSTCLVKEILLVDVYLGSIKGYAVAKYFMQASSLTLILERWIT